MKTSSCKAVVLLLLTGFASMVNAAVSFRPIGSSYNTMNVRYIRDYITTGTVGVPCWIEIQAYNVSGVNVAENTTVKAYKLADNSEISLVNSSTSGVGNALVTDGITSNTTYAATSYPTYVVVDLGSVKPIAYLKIFHYYNNTPRAYYGTKTEVSEDGVTWVTVYDSNSSDGIINSSMYRETANGRTIYIADKISRNDNITMLSTGGKITFPQVTESITVGETIVTLANFYREGYVFAGWTTKPDGTGTHVAAGAELVPTQNVYYAEWSPAPCTLNLDFNATNGTETIRYIRDYANGNTTNSTQSHWIEIKACNSAGTNVALNKTVKAYNSSGTEISLTNAAKLVDGDTTHAAYADVNTNYNAYVVVDLGSAQQISYLKIFHYWDDLVPRAYYGTKTEVSADGVTWRTVFDSKSINGTIGGNMYRETHMGHTVYLGNNVSMIGVNSISVPQGSNYVYDSYEDFKGLQLPTVTREGYALRGWNTKADGTGTAYPTTISVAASTFGTNATLYAQWGSYILSIDPNGGTYNNQAGVQNVDVTSLPMALNLPKHLTQVFKCWTGSAEKHISNYQDIPCSSSNEVAFNGTAYTITNGGDYHFTDEFTVNLWAYKSTWLNSATRLRVNVDASNNGFDIVLNTQTTNVRFEYYGQEKRIFTTNKESQTLAAGWHQFTLTYDGTILHGYIDAIEVFNSERSVASTTASAYGTMFTGKMRNVSVLHHAMSASEIKMQYANPNVAYYFGADANADLTAVWQSGYTVVFNANGGTGTMSNIVCEPAQTYSLSTNLFTYQNYTFTGWNTQYNGTGTAYSDNQEITNLATAGSSITLYAQWQLSAAILTINPNGGSYKGSTANYDEIIGAVPIVVAKPTHTSKSFFGWSGTGEPFISNCQNFTSSSFEEITFDTAKAVTLLPYNANYHYDKFTANVWAFNNDWSTFTSSINNTNCTFIGCMQTGGWKIYASNNGKYIGFQCTTKGGGITVMINSASEGARTWASLEPGWHMLTMVYDGSTLTAYLDGEQYCSSVAISGDLAPNYDETLLVIGGDPNSTGGLEAKAYFRGKMKNVSLMNYAMTAEDVSRQYQNPNATYYFSRAVDEGLTANWTTRRAVTINPNGGSYKNSTSTVTETITAIPQEVYNPVRTDSAFFGWSGTGEKYLSRHHNFTTSSSDEITFDGATAMQLKPYISNYDYDKFTANMWAFNDDWSTFTSSINNTNCSFISCMQTGGWKIYASNNGEYIGFQCTTKAGGASATINKASLGAKTWASLDPGWHMITLVYTGSKMIAYLDGEQYCDTVSISGNIAPNYAATILAIGGDPNSTGVIEANSYFKGKLKNVGIMNYAMTPQEVRLQYNNPNATYYYYPGSTLTLKAQWQKGYSVIYDANGGEGLMNPQPCTNGQTYQIADNSFARSGYTFAEWNTAANGTGTAYTVGQQFTNIGTDGSQVTLYAQWKPIPYVITYDYNDGTSPLQTIYTANDNLVVAAAPVRGNYSFEAWLVTSASNGTWTWGNSYLANQTVGINMYGNVQMTALWKKISTTVEQMGEKNIIVLQQGSLICFYGVEDNTQMRMFDVAGRCVYNGKLNGTTLNISRIGSGVYLCNVNDKTVKILINNVLQK
ncbi:MAG: InlB B-repeat-containing protein [Paludibacteraceae bacterium]|jgi:uncharacterized repeat protein (TIGR02543 family)|nr:InlB B-repeat-containing protein [Paludibacteraceae bacterium]